MLDHTENKVQWPICLFTVTHQSYGRMLSWVNYLYFHSDKKNYLSCSPYSSLSATLCNVVSIGEYEVYWHMNFLLIKGCGTHKNNVCSHPFFEAVLQCEQTKMLPKKSTNKYNEKIVILQSIRIIVIKSWETRAVIHTCRYSNGHFNPYNLANGLNLGLNFPLKYLQV